VIPRPGFSAMNERGSVRRSEAACGLARARRPGRPCSPLSLLPSPGPSLTRSPKSGVLPVSHLALGIDWRSPLTVKASDSDHRDRD
jgi:hypothetical protein